jgi:Holliday junction resolvasome RuvABC endonuclease subunit
MKEGNLSSEEWKKKIISLGIDLAWSSPTGYALVEISGDDERVIKTGIITVPSGKVTERLQQERAKALFDGLVGILIDFQKEFRPNLIAYESAEEWLLGKARSPYRFRHRTRTNLAALLSLGAAKACLWFASIWAAPDVPLVKYEPNYVRRHFSAGLIITNTVREEVAEMHPGLSGVKLSSIESVLARTSFLAPTHHEADAVALAVVAGREFLLSKAKDE